MDRNDTVQIVIVIVHASLSARRAWIEIFVGQVEEKIKAVALRKESVDRNIHIVFTLDSSGTGRSPQGERG